MEFAYLEINRRDHIQEVKKAIDERRLVKKDLEKRSRELRVQADRIRRTDPIKARLLEHRGIVLADEAYRIDKENRHGMTPEQIKRSAALARLALAMDGMKK